MQLSTTIEISRLRLYARHGVMEQERVVGNLFEVSLKLECADPRAGADDSLGSTVNYADVIATVRREMSISSQLIEHVAHRICSAISDGYPGVSGGSVTVRKLTPPCGAELEGVGVTVNWRR